MARANGSRRIRATRSPRPTTRPACGPPTSLSPENVTMSAPAAREAAAPAATREPDRQRDRGGVVRQDDRVLGPGQRDEMLLGNPEAPAATAGRPIELKEERAARCPVRRRDRGSRPQRPA